MTQSMGTTAATNDIYLGANGDVVILQGQAAVQQACSNVSRASLGEEVLATDSGIPFFQSVFVGVPNLAVFENYLRRALLGVDGVVAVTNLSTSLDKVDGKTILNYTATIENQFGLRFQASGGIPSA